MFLQSGFLYAQERHAFILGNSAYQGNAALKNPRNDAIDMAAELERIGYKVHSGGALLDLNLREFRSQFNAFVKQLPNDALAFFYFAGHGISDGVQNYLIPVDSGLEEEWELPDLAMPLNQIIRGLNSQRKKGLNIVILDACRDNPLANQYRSVRNGLTEIRNAPRRLFIGYAAAEGEIAADGRGANGVYTGELLKQLRQNAGRPIQELHSAVANAVLKLTNEKQFPVADNRFTKNVCIGICVTIERQDSTKDLVKENEEPSKKLNPWLIGAAVVAAVLLVSGGDDKKEDGFRVRVEPPIE